MSESQHLDGEVAREARDEGGLREVQRAQLDRLLLEAGDDPQIRAAISAMFFIALHQDNTVEQHIIAHREALRDDLSHMVEQIEERFTLQMGVIQQVVARLDDADAVRRTKFEALEMTQERQNATLTAQAWILWTIGGVLMASVLLVLVYVVWA